MAKLPPIRFLDDVFKEHGLNPTTRGDGVTIQLYESDDGRYEGNVTYWGTDPVEIEVYIEARPDAFGPDWDFEAEYYQSPEDALKGAPALIEKIAGREWK